MPKFNQQEEQLEKLLFQYKDKSLESVEVRKTLVRDILNCLQNIPQVGKLGATVMTEGASAYKKGDAVVVKPKSV